MFNDDFLPLTASEAREMTDQFLADKNEKQLKEIFQKIRMKIVEGQYCLNLQEPLAPCNKQILEEYGYKIIDKHTQALAIMSYVIIDWSGFEFKKGV